MKQYELGERLYESSQTEVFWAKQTDTGEDVILKFLRKRYPSDEEISRFSQEYDITKNLSDKHIRKIQAYEQFDNRHCLVLEPFKAVPLNAYQHEIRNLNTFLDCAIRITEGLAAVHEAGIIHKDIKPANILISENRRDIKIIDFGLASRLVVKQQNAENPENLEGTLAYISPEQTGRVNHPVDVTSDLYSLGITFYELLTGKKPLQAEDALEWIHKHLTAKITPPSALLNSKIIVPKIISDIVIKLTAKNPDDRYQTARGLLHDLRICSRDVQQTGIIAPFRLGEEDITEKFKIYERLYGRESETAELLKMYERTAAGAVCMVTVSGYSGIGKSALVKELFRPITETRGLFLQGKFDQFQQNVPYRALIACLNDFAAYLISETEDNLGQWKEKIGEALGGSAQILVKIAPDLTIVLGEQEEPEAVDAAEEQNRFTAAFRKFIRIISQAEHPLTMFFDDLQWADRASLKLLQTLATDLENEYLMLIGAYRHNEIDEAHFLRPVLRQIEEQNPNFLPFYLKPLKEEDIAALLADSLHTSIEKIRDLSLVILQKTQGNPFFVNQLLLALYEKNLLYFENRTWHWHTEVIRNMNVSENVVDLLTEKLEKFSHDCRRSLRLAACLGNTFSLRFLAQLSGQNQRAVLDSIWEALREGLILPLSQSYRFVTENTQHDDAEFRFLHDRVQQACMEGLSAEERKYYFLQIARLGVQNGAEYLEEWLLDLTNYYNQASDLINEEERETLIDLNAKAMFKAKRNIAYDAALDYAKAGLRLSGESAWEKNHERTLNFCQEITDCAFLAGQFDESERMFEETLRHCKNEFELADTYIIRILNKILVGQFVDAILLSYMALALFKIDLPAFDDINGLLGSLEQYFRAYKTLMKDSDVASLMDLPLSNNRGANYVIKIISQVIFPSYLTNPPLYALLATISVNFSIENGNCEESVPCYTFFPNVLSLKQEYDDCYAMSMMSMRLAKKMGIKKHDCKINYMTATVASFLKDHLETDIAYYHKAIEIGMQTGDMLFAGIAESRLTGNEFIAGKRLDDILPASEYRFKMLQKSGSPFAFIELFVQGVVRGLSAPESETPCILGESKEQEEHIVEAWTQANFGTGVALYRLYKMQALYHFGRYEEALAEAEKGFAMLQFIATIIEEPIFLFFHTLCITANYEKLSQEERNSSFEMISAHISRMKLWSVHCPANFEHLLCGMRAEKARLEGNNFKAMELYRKAINLSRKNSFINFEAIMCELAARFYQKADFPRIARTFYTEAHYIYTLWGAHGKAKWLETNNPDYVVYLETRNTGARSGSIALRASSNLSALTGITQHESMDLASLMKSTLVISGNVRLEDLLGNMLKVVMENAGAQRGVLILANQEGVLRIQAELSLPDEPEVLQNKALSQEANVPLTLIRYCERSKSPYVSENLSKENLFVKDVYIKEHNPISVLCVPILHQGKLKAIIYLENNFMKGVFNAKRIAIVNLLAGQVATSLENALLYASMEERVEARTRELNEANELLKYQHQRIADSIRYAQTMQSSILPTKEDLDSAFAEHFVIFRPKDIVSGDFYWYNRFENQHILALADCTGHGVPGAFMSMIGNSALDEIVKVKKINNPSVILEMLQSSIDEALRQRTRDGMDIAIIVVERLDNGLFKILFSSAKISLFYMEGEKAVRLKGTRKSIGGGMNIGKANFELDELHLPEGTRLYLCTDGFPDQCDANRISFKMTKVVELFEYYSEMPLKNQGIVFENILNEFMGTQEQRDDITLIGIKL